MIKHVTSTLLAMAAAFALSGAPALAETPQQEKMKACNADAGTGLCTCEGWGSATGRIRPGAGVAAGPVGVVEGSLTSSSQTSM